MSHVRLFAWLVLFAAVFSPTPALAVVFGLTPSVFEIQATRVERVAGFIEIVRANPDTDAYLLVSVRDDPVQAIVLTSGERVLLPLGHESVKYEFEIDASRIDPSNVLEAGIEFLSEDTQNGSDGVALQLGGVVKIRVDVVPEGTVMKQDVDVVVASSNDGLVDQVVAFVRSPGAQFLALALLAFFVCVGLWASGRRGWFEGIVFVVCAFVFTVALFGWALLSGRADIYLWTNSQQMEIPLNDGSFFLLASDVTDDVFLYPAGEKSQVMEGDWRYIATAYNRMFVVPSTREQRDLYENRIFKFLESTIQPYAAQDLPGLVTGARENAQGIYAVFTGEREQDGTTFWCLANVWDKEAISCVLLDSLVREPITSVSFSPTQKQIAVVHTKQGVYQYDAWKNTIVPIDSSAPDAWKPLEFPQPLMVDGTSTRLWLVWLDGKRILASGKRTYFPLTSSVWLERVDIESGSRVFIVDTRTFARTFLTDVSDNERLYWLQNGGFITSP